MSTGGIEPEISKLIFFNKFGDWNRNSLDTTTWLSNLIIVIQTMDTEDIMSERILLNSEIFLTKQIDEKCLIWRGFQGKSDLNGGISSHFEEIRIQLAELNRMIIKMVEFG